LLSKGFEGAIEMRGIFRNITLAIFTCTCLYSKAAIPPSQLRLDPPAAAKIVQNTKAAIDVAKVIPLNLQPGQSEEQVGLRILDRSVSSAMQTDFFKNTEIGKAAKGFESALKTDMKLGGDPKKGGVTHHIDMQLQAFEQKAYLQYRGITDLRVTYHTNDSNLDMELNQDLGHGTHLLITHNLNEALSRANISWNW
jgi:hypothetical protein